MSFWSASRRQLRGDAAKAAAARWRGPVDAHRRMRLHGCRCHHRRAVRRRARPAGRGSGADHDRRDECEQSLPVVAVDLPSGINGTTGGVMGAAVRATGPSRSSGARPGICCCRDGCIAGRSRSWISAFPPACSTPSSPKTFANGPQLWRAQFPVPKAESHKYARGHAVIGVRRPVEYRRGAAGGTRGIAGRRRPGDLGQPARSADGQSRRRAWR